MVSKNEIHNLQAMRDDNELWRPVNGFNMPPEGKEIQVKSREGKIESVFLKDNKWWRPDLTGFLEYSPVYWRQY